MEITLVLETVDEERILEKLLKRYSNEDYQYVVEAFAKCFSDYMEEWFSDSVYDITRDPQENDFDALCYHMDIALNRMHGRPMFSKLIPVVK